jgi:hypothetical protein
VSISILVGGEWGLGMQKILASDEAVFDCSREKLYHALIDLKTYSQWWPAIVGFRLVRAEPNYIGSTTQVRPFRTIRFDYKIARLKENEEVAFTYSGSARGIGIWHIRALGDKILAKYEIDLTLDNWFMILVSKCISLRWVHSVLMKQAFKGLRDFLQKE